MRFQLKETDRNVYQIDFAVQFPKNFAGSVVIKMQQCTLWKWRIKYYGCKILTYYAKIG
jgi:hypothetical protein